MVLEAVRGDLLCGRLMTVPGVGPITALAFKTGVDVPERFAKSKTVGEASATTGHRNLSRLLDRAATRPALP